MKDIQVTDNILIIDANNLMCRHFFTKTDFCSNTGVPTGAIYGVLKALKSYAKEYNPVQIYMCFDKKHESFRNKLYPEYKANRTKTDERLKSQFPLIKKICHYSNIPCLEVDRYEADDIVGGLSVHASTYGFTPYVISGDRDLFQLIAYNIDILYLNNKGIKKIDSREFVNMYNGLEPKQFLDFKALVGDKSDNIPGVKGVGEKTATKLLLKYKTLNNIYKNIDNITGKLNENLRNNKNIVELSKKLCEIKTDINLDYNYYFELMANTSFNFKNPKVLKLCNELDIKNI